MTRERNRSVRSRLHDALDAILQDGTLKLIRSPTRLSESFQIREQLSGMNGQQLFDWP